MSLIVNIKRRIHGLMMTTMIALVVCVSGMREMTKLAR